MFALFFKKKFHMNRYNLRKCRKEKIGKRFANEIGC